MGTVTVESHKNQIADPDLTEISGTLTFSNSYATDGDTVTLAEITALTAPFMVNNIINDSTYGWIIAIPSSDGGLLLAYRLDPVSNDWVQFAAATDLSGVGDLAFSGVGTDV